MNRYVNNQNCHIQDDDSPHQVHQEAMYLQKVTVCYGFWTSRVNGPNFFENNVDFKIELSLLKNPLQGHIWT